MFIQSHHVSLKIENFSDPRRERCGRGEVKFQAWVKTLHHWWFEDGARNMMRSVGGLKELREGPVWELARMRGAQPATAKNWILPALRMSLRSGSTMTPKTRQGQDQDWTASTWISANTGPQFITYTNSKMEEQSEVLVPHTRVGTSQIPRKGDISPFQKGWH